MKNCRKLWLRGVLVSFSILAAGIIGGRVTQADIFHLPPAQESFPAPPADRTLIYFAGEAGALVPLIFETGTTPLTIDAVAKGDKRSYVELKGERGATVITNIEPRFYVFLADDGHAKPPFIVRLTEKRGARRVSAMAQKGYKGFAIDSEEIVKPHYRVLGHENGMLFMEIRTREPLMLGEYAIIGTDLKQIATFRVAAASNAVR
ncbi:MAG: hypothetical protein QOH25_2767 [Acidobacteriota bacterium]|nr:hypothetical protein [Acidobacteriota bacterium]